MSDYIETMWAQFVIETEEHLELIEPLLVEAEFNALVREDVDQLFRSFHSIKGLSKAMDLLGMETIAHRAEDILGLVRDEVIIVSAEIADVLLTAIDALKQHLRLAESTRQDQTPVGELIGNLENIFNNATGATVKKDIENIGFDNTGSDNSGLKKTVLDNSAVDTVNEVSDQQASSLHSDPDMVIFFAELLQSNLPKLSHLLDPEFAVDSEATKEIVSELETLIHATTTMELSQLADAFSSILNLLSDKEISTKVLRGSLIESLMVVVELTRLIEGEVKQECGTSLLVVNLRACAAEMIDRIFQELAEQLQAIAASSDDKTLSDTSEIVELTVKTAEKACLLNHHLHVLDGNDTSKRLLLTVSEVCNHINQGQAVAEEDLIKLLLNAVNVAESEYRSIAENGEAYRSSVDLNALHQTIWDAIKQQSDVTCNKGVISFKDLAGKIEINPIFEDCMSIDSLQLLKEGLEEGCQVYEALVNLEESETFTASFLQWIEKDIQLVTNSTVFIDDKPWSDCLLLTKQSAGTLRESVKALDPERQFLKLETCTKVVENTPVEVPAATRTPAKELSMLRVSGTTLDQFMSQIGEMVSIRGMLSHIVHFEGAGAAINTLKQLGGVGQNADFNNEHFLAQLDVLEQQLARFDQVDQKLHAVLSQLQDNALALRVVPMETVFKRLPRPVRDLAQAQGKQVKLEMTGQDVRIDKAMVEVLSDPLMHMVRNSVDHGIELPEERLRAGKTERAVVGLDARQQGNTVKVTITDDGRGINVDAVKAKALAKGLASEEDLRRMSQEEILQFIFAPGFSTAEQITETSGRGVGMDVVRTNVMKMGGNVTVESETGKGSCFTLELPLSAAIQDTVLVKTSGQMMAIPERYVSEMIEIRRTDVQSVKGCQAIVLRDRFLPIYRLGPLLGYRTVPDEHEEMITVVVLSDGKQRIGVIIESSYLRQELFIKDIHEQLTALPGVSGASILGDGKVVLILDVEDLFTLAATRGKTALLALDDGEPCRKVSERGEVMEEGRVA